MAAGATKVPAQKTGEGEMENGKKLFYVRAHRTGNMACNWFVMDAKGEYTDVDPSITTYYPSPIRDLKDYATLAIDLKIYFLGGEIRPESNHELEPARIGNFRGQVSVFNTLSKTWVDKGIEPMNSPRSKFMAVAAKNRIYVFGSHHAISKLILSKEHWGECYDFDTKKWRYLTLSPPEEVYRSRFIYSPIVHGVLIYFWVSRLGVYTFHLDKHIWSKVDFPLPRNMDKQYFTWSGHRWSDQVAIVDDFLFYHFFGKIYAYDIKNNKGTHLVYTFAEVKQHLRSFHSPPLFLTHTFLVNIGCRKLLLLWVDGCKQDLVHCHQFLVQKDVQEDGSPAIIWERGSRRTIDCWDIADVLELSAV